MSYVYPPSKFIFSIIGQAEEENCCEIVVWNSIQINGRDLFSQIQFSAVEDL